MSEGEHQGDLRRLLALNGRRLVAAARHPSFAGVLTTLLPLSLVFAVLWAARDSAPALSNAGDAAALSMMMSAPLAFLSYSTLFRGLDDAFLRRLGCVPTSMYAERAARLLSIALLLLVVLITITVSSGRDVEPALRVGLGAVVAAWATGAAATSAAARAMAGARPGQGWGCLTVGMWDAEMRRVAPLVYAPLVPLLAGALGGTVAWSNGWGGAIALTALSVVVAGSSARWWAAALPRFGPRHLEMAFVPPAPPGAGELRPRRGVGRLLPREAAIVWSRDSVVVGRRYPWAGRIVWPVLILSLVLLARWGRDPEVRGWVVMATLTAWALQMAAVIGLGRYERGSRRWIDRSLGFGALNRLLGRWAGAWGSMLWVALPLAAAWGWWAEAGSGWPWVAVSAGAALIAATSSTALSGWR